MYCLNFAHFSINSFLRAATTSSFFFQTHLLKRSASQRENHAIY